MVQNVLKINAEGQIIFLAGFSGAKSTASSLSAATAAEAAATTRAATSRSAAATTAGAAGGGIFKASAVVTAAWLIVTISLAVSLTISLAAVLRRGPSFSAEPKGLADAQV